MRTRSATPAGSWHGGDRLLHHTDCGVLTFTDDDFKQSIQDDVGSSRTGRSRRSAISSRTSASRSRASRRAVHPEQGLGARVHLRRRDREAARGVRRLAPLEHRGSRSSSSVMYSGGQPQSLPYCAHSRSCDPITAGRSISASRPGSAGDGARSRGPPAQGGRSRRAARPSARGYASAELQPRIEGSAVGGGVSRAGRYPAIWRHS
jgi:hypothetical protein